MNPDKEPRIAIMQPYFFPYIGYYQLINAVDVFVIYDDGKMIKTGFIHRNSILGTEKIPTPHRISLQLVKNSCNLAINEVQLKDDAHIGSIIRAIRCRYHRAPYYDCAFPVLEEALMCKKRKLSEYLECQIREICDYLGIRTRIVLSSGINKDGLDGVEAKAYRICDHYGISSYVNPAGGVKFYSKQEWARHGIRLDFLTRRDSIIYRQFKEPFVPDLSIIDVMMFNSRDSISEMLGEYDLS